MPSLWCQVMQVQYDQPLFVDVFAGSENLTAAFALQGFAVMPIDIRKGTEFDMHGNAMPAFIKDVVMQHHKKGGIVYCHFAPPCSTYSSARFPKIRTTRHPNGIAKNLLATRERVVLAQPAEWPSTPWTS